MNLKRLSYGLLLSILALQAQASDFINITVKTKIPSAAIGFKVDRTKSGSLGALHRGQGPKDREYVFGYRKSLLGKDIRCGATKLNQDTTVILKHQGDYCSFILSTKAK